MVSDVGHTLYTVFELMISGPAMSSTNCRSHGICQIYKFNKKMHSFCYFINFPCLYSFYFSTIFFLWIEKNIKKSYECIKICILCRKKNFFFFYFAKSRAICGWIFIFSFLFFYTIFCYILPFRLSGGGRLLFRWWWRGSNGFWKENNNIVVGSRVLFFIHSTINAIHFISFYTENRTECTYSV
jgi:hypothetical protein